MKTFTSVEQPYGYVTLENAEWYEYPNMFQVGYVIGTVIEGERTGAFFGGVPVAGTHHEEKVGETKRIDNVTKVQFKHGKRSYVAM